MSGLKLHNIYSVYKIVKAVSRLAYVLGYRLGKKTRRRG